ncbi:MAG: hypothetical protein V3V54_05075 [Candidatus Brocadiales bacterium]
MPVIIGIDEAGYGPTLGPLVITATAFDVPVHPGTGETSERRNSLDGPNLWHILKEAISGYPNDGGRNDRRIVVGDSKKLYSAKKGLYKLEEAVLTFQMSLGGNICELKDLLTSLGCYDGQLLEQYPWYHDKRLGLPVVSDMADLTHKYNKLKDILSSNGVKYLAASSVVISPHEFNKDVARLDNKSLLLFKNCVNLIAGLWQKYPEMEVFCDKHGGRDRYGPMLAKAFRDSRVKKLSENGKSSSCYEVMDGAARRRMRISFLMDADNAHLPVALASMHSKYVRELFLRLFNGFWREHLPGLRPTAGYPEDARRFLRDISDLKTRLGISDKILIRNR